MKSSMPTISRTLNIEICAGRIYYPAGTKYKDKIEKMLAINTIWCYYLYGKHYGFLRVGFRPTLFCEAF